MARRPTKEFLSFVSARLPRQHIAYMLNALCYRPSVHPSVCSSVCHRV